MIPFEDFLWMIILVYTIIIIYETLLEKVKRELIDRRMFPLFLGTIIVLGIFFFLLFTGKSSIFVLESKYAYFCLSIVFFLFPTILFIIKFPKLFKKCLPLSVYILYLTILFEITATRLNQWIFTGKYLIPPFSVFTNTPIPYEELFFVGIIGPIVTISLYEFFDDVVPKTIHN